MKYIFYENDPVYYCCVIGGRLAAGICLDVRRRSDPPLTRVCSYFPVAHPYQGYMII